MVDNKVFMYALRASDSNMGRGDETSERGVGGERIPDLIEGYYTLEQQGEGFQRRRLKW